MNGMGKVRFFLTFFIFNILIIFLGTNIMGETPKNFYQSLPNQINGWVKKPAVRYVRENLFDYINGGAELYISYNFSHLDSFKYMRENNGEINIDIFDMGNSHNAYGIFSHGRETEDNLVGQGSEYASGLLTFWQDRYYISILAYPETPEKRDMVKNLGELISQQIQTLGPLPPIISLLSEENLVPQSIHYFFHYIWLNSFHFISNENILQIDSDTPSVLARYVDSDTSYLFLLIQYPDKNRTEAALKSFKKEFLTDPEKTIQIQKNGKWAAVDSKGNRILILLNLSSKKKCQHYMNKHKDFLK